MNLLGRKGEPLDEALYEAKQALNDVLPMLSGEQIGRLIHIIGNAMSQAYVAGHNSNESNR